MKIGGFLKGQRLLRNQAIAVVAARTEIVTAARLSQIEIEAATPTKEEVRAICNVLNVDADNLLKTFTGYLPMPKGGPR